MVFALLTTLDPETFFHSVCNFDLTCSMGIPNFISLGNSLISVVFTLGISSCMSSLCTPFCALHNFGNSGKDLMKISSSNVMKVVQSNRSILMCLGVIILCMIVCAVIHNCLSSGSLFFASLRWNN